MLKTVLRSLFGAVFRWQGAVGVTYHRIGDGASSTFDRGLFSASADGFDQQVRFLKENFDIIAPADLADVLRGRRGRHVLITFDDGYADNHEIALPILTAHRVPGTFFVATGFVDHPRITWWDEIAWMVRTCRHSELRLPEFIPEAVVFDEPGREQAIRTILRVYKKLPSSRTALLLEAIGAATGVGRFPEGLPYPSWMTWDMLRAMRDAGMTIGGHAVSHEVLARMPKEQQQEEITQCARRLKEELQLPMHAFSYPVGNRDSFNRDTRDCLREVGVQYAFSYYGGYRRLDEWDPLDIRRMSVEREDSLATFRAMLSAPQLTEG